MVQFDHRMLAYATLAGTTALWLASRRRGLPLPPALQQRLAIVAAAAWGQASLGVATILMEVPVSLGVLHQAGALTIWTLSLWALHGMRFAGLGAAAAGSAAAVPVLAASLPIALAPQ